MFSSSLIQRALKPPADSVGLRGLASEVERAYETVANVNVHSTGAQINPGGEAADLASLAKFIKQAGLEFETYNREVMAQNYSAAYNVLSVLRSTVTQVVVDAEKARQHADQASGHVPIDIGSIIPGTPLWAQALHAKVDLILSKLG